MWDSSCRIGSGSGDPDAFGSGFPAVAVGGAGDELVGGFDVGDFHGGFVPLDGLLGADGEIAKEDEFGEGGGVVEV